MSGGLPAVCEIKPRLAGLYRLLEQCSDDIGGCEVCSEKADCELFCEKNIYESAEVSPVKCNEYMAEIILRRARRTRVRGRAAGQPACVIYTAGLSHVAKAPQLVCGRR